MIAAAIALMAAAFPPAPDPARHGGEKTYHFGREERLTTIRFEARAQVGTLVGFTHRASGSAQVDFEAGSGRCKVSVPVDSLTFGVAGIDNALRMAAWMDSKNHPLLEFAADKAAPGPQPDTWRVDGRWTMRGVSRPLSVLAQVTPLPEPLGRRLGPGEWIRVRARWTLRLSDHGIKIPEKSLLTVADSWTVSLDMLGSTEPPTAAAPPKDEDEETFRPVRPEKIDPPEAPGRRYKLGKKPQLSTFLVEAPGETGTALALSKIASGWIVLDGAQGKIKLSAPAKAFKTGLRDLDGRIPDLLSADANPHLRFESTAMARKEDGTWTVKGSIEARGTKRPVELEAAMRSITGEQMAAAGWGEKEAVGFSAALRIRPADFGIPVPEGWLVEWTLLVDLLGELEE